jgi:hypothetical protein
VKAAVGVQGGWIEATMRDWAAPLHPHTASLEPLRAWGRWLIGQYEVRLQTRLGASR